MSEQDSHLNCVVTGFEFIVSIGVNGHDEEDAIKNLKEMMPECPYFITPLKNSDVNTYDELIKILLNHCGETGENEGAVDTLNRLIKEVKNK